MTSSLILYVKILNDLLFTDILLAFEVVLSIIRLFYFSLQKNAWIPLLHVFLIKILQLGTWNNSSVHTFLDLDNSILKALKRECFLIVNNQHVKYHLWVSYMFRNSCLYVVLVYKRQYIAFVALCCQVSLLLIPRPDCTGGNIQVPSSVTLISY